MYLALYPTHKSQKAQIVNFGPKQIPQILIHISGQCYERRRLGREYGMAEQHAAEQEIEIFGSGVVQKWSACRL